jgi:chaperonin GroES
MHLKPADDRIIAVPTKPQEKTASGVYLSEGSKAQMPTCKVVAVGTHVSKFKEGDVLVYTKSFGSDSTVQELEMGNDKYVFLKEADVLAKVEE